MEIVRLVFIIFFQSLAFGSDWPQIPNDYAGFVQDDQGHYHFVQNQGLVQDNQGLVQDNQGISGLVPDNQVLVQDDQGLVQDNQGLSGFLQDDQGQGNCQDGNCPTMVRPKPNSFAQKAAKAAKEASDAQVPAGAAAARQVQKLLAEKAATAAKAAEAAYVGKQQLVEQIQTELREGRLVVRKERARLMATKATAAEVRRGVNQAMEEVKALTDVMKKAREGVAHSERVVAGSHQAVVNQKHAVAEARGRLELLLKQVDLARLDYKNTKVAVEKAACAALEARQRAGRERRMLEMAYHTQTVEQTFFPNQ